MFSSVAKAAAGAVTAIGAVVGAFFSPLLLVAGVFVLGTLVLAALAVVVVVLIAVWTRDRVRHAQAIAVLDRFLLAWRGMTAPAPAVLPPYYWTPLSAPRRRRRRR